ncbi:39S ribosomal protein L36, mitochondrial [Lucilia cuprina]|uniref:39S ribosomal protein L36, mitochondrial n=1 Tax=Lucilia cuprina TaxID=7375 RepID=UPI000C71B5B3|nr:39S ribosomal protein L36, mitochondrial [Lucilia cuprina]
MSFATKICAPLIHNGFKQLVAPVANTTARNFHMMIKPLPKNITTETSLTQNPIASSVLSPISVVGSLQRLLAPVSSLINQVAGFKVKGRLKRRCKDCYIVVRQQRHYVICPTHPRHKQMSMKKREYKSWILTHATQSKVRPY